VQLSGARSADSLDARWTTRCKGWLELAKGAAIQSGNCGLNYFIDKYNLNSEGREAFHRELGRIKKAGDATDDDMMDAVARELADQTKYVRNKS
jgi:hypothetical protein